METLEALETKKIKNACGDAAYSPQPLPKHYGRLSRQRIRKSRQVYDARNRFLRGLLWTFAALYTRVLRATVLNVE